MKFKSMLFYILGMIIFAQCSTNPDNSNRAGSNNSNGSGNTVVPIPDRKPTSFYTELLSGEIQDQLDSNPLTISPIKTMERGTDTYRLEDSKLVRAYSLDNVREQRGLMHDVVEDIVITRENRNVYYTFKTVITRRGTASLGNPAKRYWSNEVVLLQMEDFYVPEGDTSSTLLDENGQRISIPEGYTIRNIAPSLTLRKLIDNSAQFPDEYSNILDSTTIYTLIKFSATEINIIYLKFVNLNTARMVDGVVHTYTRI